MQEHQATNFKKQRITGKTSPEWTQSYVEVTDNYVVNMLHSVCVVNCESVLLCLAKINAH